MRRETPDVDAVIVGGSFAGCAAALQLGRGRRRTLVIDAGRPRNRMAPRAHGLPGRDGVPPGELLAAARRDLARYPTVALRDGTATVARPCDAGFAVTTGDGTVTATCLVLAFGVKDRLPDIDGVRELWGTGVLHCPYCHGYEVADRRLGVLGIGPASIEQALMLPDWSDEVILFSAAMRADAEAARDALAARGVRLEPTPVARLVVDGGRLAGVALADGRVVDRDAVYTLPYTSPASPIAGALGCALDDGPLGPVVRVDRTTQETSVPRVFAAGDITRPLHKVALAMADGTAAGIFAHHAIVAARGGAVAGRI